MQAKTGWEACYEFNRYLHAAPTAALDRYRSICSDRYSSPEAEFEFLNSSEAIKLALNFKNWESCPHEELTGLKEPTKGSTVSKIADINPDVWNALIASKTPMLWADIISEEGSLTRRHANTVFKCFYALGGPWTSSILATSSPSRCRDLVPSDFARAHFLKCVDVLSISWDCREVADSTISTFMEGLTDQMTQIHRVYELEDQLLIDSKIAHVALWRMSYMDRLSRNGRRLASMSCFHAFKHVFDAIMTRDAPQAWLSSVVQSVGAKDLMNAIRTVVFVSSLVDEILAISTQTLYDLVSVVPEQCGISTMYGPSEFLRQCSLVLNRQLAHGGEGPQAFELTWSYDLAVWKYLYRLHILPYFYHEGIAIEMMQQLSSSIFAMQWAGSGILLKALEVRSQLASPIAHQETPDAVLGRLATEFYDQTIEWIESIRKEAGEGSTLTLALKREYIAVARERWLSLAVQLHAARPQLALTAAYTPLMRTWSTLGSLAGLHFDRMCSNAHCQYHRTTSEKPLLVCKGCQGARYCSRECQRSDWKGHKPQCRRLK